MPANPKEILESLLKDLGFEATVEETLIKGGHLLKVQTENGKHLIGTDGETLQDLQYMVNRLALRQDSDAPRVTVDVDGWRENKQQALEERTRNAADKVRKSGDVIEFGPMNSFERWVVHQQLKDDPQVESVSVEILGSVQKAIIIRPR